MRVTSVAHKWQIRQRIKSVKATCDAQHNKGMTNCQRILPSCGTCFNSADMFYVLWYHFILSKYPSSFSVFIHLMILESLNI